MMVRFKEGWYITHLCVLCVMCVTCMALEKEATGLFRVQRNGFFRVKPPTVTHTYHPTSVIVTQRRQ